QATHAGNHRLLVNVQTGTATNDDVHGNAPGDVAGEDIEPESNLLCVLPTGWGQQFRVRGDVRDQTDTRAQGTRPARSTAAAARTRRWPGNSATPALPSSRRSPWRMRWPC